MHDTKTRWVAHYRTQGLMPIPLHGVRDDACTCRLGEKCTSKGKHPRIKRQDAVAAGDSDWQQWLQRWPDMNLGILTGEETGIFALDIDPRHGGVQSIAQIEAAHGPFPATVTASTGGGGLHYLFHIPPGARIGNSCGAIAPGIDIRGNGGLIVVAPSVTKAAYAWKEPPSREAIAAPPRWLLGKVENRPAESATMAPMSVTDASLAGFREPFLMPPDGSVQEGHRNNFLASSAGWMQRNGTKGQALAELLNAVNIAKCVPPLSEQEVVRTAKSIQGYEAALIASPANEGSWPDQKDIKENLPPVLAFDPGWLPDELSAWAQDIAERMNCPVDFPAVAVLVALGAAIGARIHCRPLANGTWEVPGNLWGMLVAPPGAMKSPAIHEALRPLVLMDRQAAEAYQAAYRQYEVEKAIHESEFKKQIKSNPAAAATLTAPQEPQMARYLVIDSTYEMLVAIAAANPHGFLVVRDELAGWFHSLEKENQKEARGLYLTGWAGTDGYATDRIGRGHVRADRVVISLLGTIQPNVLRSRIYDAVAGGVGDDGLVQRFQLAVYPDPVPKWVKVDRQPNRKAEQHYIDLIEKFIRLDPAAVGATFPIGGNPYLPFSRDGQVVFDRWREILENRIRNNQSDEHPAMRNHLGKFRSLFPKLALILHLAAGGTGPISRDAAMRALRWTLYLDSHAKRMYYTATNRTMQCASTLANKIRAGRLPDPFTRSDVLLKEWVNLRTAEEVGMAITVLRDMGWIVVYEDRRTGGRPAERCHINPKVKRAA